MDTIKYIKAVGEVREAMKIKPSWLRITTITMIGREICGPIQAKVIRGLFNVIGSLKVNKNEWTVQKSKKGAQFYNCVSIGYNDAYSKKHVKLFKNGSVQIAGCSSILDCKHVVEQLKIILPVILNKEIDMEWSDFDVVMINGTFNVPQKIHLFNLYRILENDPKYSISYDPESYPAMSVRWNVRQDKKVYAKLFTTGSVQISGCRTLMECVEAYRVVNEISMTCRVGQDVDKDQKEIIFGHSFESWIKKLGV